MKFPTVVRTTARQARDCPLDSPHPWKIEQTVRASVEETPGAFLARERKIVTSAFVANAEIMTGRAPFRAMRQHASPAFFAKLREKMRQFMTQCPIDLRKSVCAQSRVQ